MLRRGVLLARCHASVRRPNRSLSSLSAAQAAGAPIDVHPEVQEALSKNKAVVALETTIVTHGMPQPTNLETARAVETIVREQGAVPATMGIIHGQVKIGLSSRELEYLADVKHNPDTVKVSRRDLGPLLALQGSGGTTCSTTLMFAAMAGIKVFATGGLGGVHRGGELSMDVSADLPELSRCPVGLVSAGVKSILDIGRTLEYLETLGVPVVSYGTDEFPAFYSSKSGFKSPWRVDDPLTAARVLLSQQELGVSTGAIFAVPIPEEHEAAGQVLQAAVEQALEEAEVNGVSKRGKEATPWLLKRVGELTAGRSLTSNVALIKNTARVGGQIAVSYAKLVNQETTSPSSDTPPATFIARTPDSKPVKAHSGTPSSADLVIIGCTAVDVTSQATTTTDAALAIHSTVPGRVTTSLGGVGRNIAEAAHRILSSQSHDRRPVLVSPIGDDFFGRTLVEETGHLGMRSDGLRQVESERSAVCNMVLDSKGNLISGVADMGIIEAFEGKHAVEAIKMYKPSIVAIDGNLSKDAMCFVVEYCTSNGIQVFFEPTSVAKSERILPAIASIYSKLNASIAPVTYVSPNLLELARLYQIASSEPLDLTSHPRWWSAIDSMGLGSQFRMDLELLARRDASDESSAEGSLGFLVEQGTAQMAINLLPFFQHIILKCGSKGVLAVFQVPSTTKESPWTHEQTNMRQRQIVAHGKNGSVVIVKHYPATVIPEGEVVNVTGAGDSLVGSLLASIVQDIKTFHDPVVLNTTIGRAQAAAVMTLKSPHAVSAELSRLLVNY